jgi:geranylgeranyl pyrophosphate synthase
MRAIAILATAGFLLAACAAAGAAPISNGGFSRTDGGQVIQLVQQKKNETIKHKVKRIWRNLTGYKFDVACPAFAFALNRTTCTANGKDREDARAKCQAQHVLCQIGDAR